MTVSILQEAHLSQRDCAALKVSWILVNCHTGVWKIAFEKACKVIGNFLRLHYWWSVVTIRLSCTVSEILPLLQCIWLPVTLRSPSYGPRILSNLCMNIFWLIDAIFLEL